MARQKATCRQVAEYLGDDGLFSDEAPEMSGMTDLATYLSFCGACERKLGGPYGSWYPHDGMRFCSFCGADIEEQGPIEGLREGKGPWAVHPLIRQEAEREARKEREREQQHKADWMCRRCGNTEFGVQIFERSHKRPTAKERTWNPTPRAHHGHRICPECKHETIVWIFDETTKSGTEMMRYDPSLPMVGPLADPEVATDA